MTNTSHDFNKVAAKLEPKHPTPFSLRLSFDERGILEHDAAGKALGAYIRDRLFGDDVTPRTVRGKTPVKDHAALGRVLGALGASRLSANLNQLAKAVNTGSLPVTPETEDDLRQACKDVQAMRRDLLIALGLNQAGSGSKTGPDLKP